jgi:hypothetical protein
MSATFTVLLSVIVLIPVMPGVIMANVLAPRRRVSELGAFGIKEGQTVWTALKTFFLLHENKLERLSLAVTFSLSITFALG